MERNNLPEFEFVFSDGERIPGDLIFILLGKYYDAKINDVYNLVIFNVYDKNYPLACQIFDEEISEDNPIVMYTNELALLFEKMNIDENNIYDSFFHKINTRQTNLFVDTLTNISDNFKINEKNLETINNIVKIVEHSSFSLNIFESRLTIT